ncbi:hypothetical protein [Streptomyces sp. NPDC006551]|uniref:hypothetical protein n=1 Tax=Streptomyces sp. NPDC006551 TaxID=3157178 RepID=UPI0033B7E491
MGKRNRRRQRERGQGLKSTAPQRIFYPSTELPLAELLLEPGTPAETADMCRAYWEFTTPGTWARPVAAIGSTNHVYKSVKAASTLALLTILCPSCAEPTTVSTRSDMTATGHWGEDFPTTPVNARIDCGNCRAATAAAAVTEREQAKARQKERDARQVENASQWVAKQMAVPIASESPGTVLAGLTLLSMVEIMEKSSASSVGALKNLDYTFTGQRSSDVEAYRQLFRGAWAVPTLPATIGDFSFDENDNVTGVYITETPWTLPAWMGEEMTERLEEARVDMQQFLTENIDGVHEALIDIDANMAVAYMNGYLVRHYNETEIAEERLPDAFASMRKARSEGFSLEQLIAVAWSSMAGAVSWGQRTRGLRPGSVAKAAVTNLERRFGYAKDRPVLEYDVPNWVPRPAARATAHRFLAEHEKTEAPIREFRALKQRMNEQASKHVEFDDDMAEASVDTSGGTPTFDFSKLFAGTPERTGHPLTFIAVAPEGKLTVLTGTRAEMQQVAGHPYNMAERLPLDGVDYLDAFVPVFADSTVHRQNPVATRMVELLGGGYGIVNGTVVFFQTGSTLNPQNLDEEHQALVLSAHRAATALVDAGPVAAPLPTTGWPEDSRPEWPAAHSDDDINDCVECGRRMYGTGLCEVCQKL